MERPQFEIYPRRREFGRDAADQPVVGELTGEFGWRYREAGSGDEDGEILAVSPKGYPDREAAEAHVERLMGAVLAIGAYPPGSFSDPQTGVAWIIEHVEEA